MFNCMEVTIYCQ